MYDITNIRYEMELDKTKLQEIVEKIAYQQTAEDQADDLFNKMGMLNEYVQEQLALHNVSQQRELLKAFLTWFDADLSCLKDHNELIDDYFNDGNDIRNVMSCDFCNSTDKVHYNHQLGIELCFKCRKKHKI